MLEEINYTFLISISPVGEARAGITFGVLKGLPIWITFLVGLAGNLLVFPLFHRIITFLNKTFWSNRTYKKGGVYFSKKAKKKTQNSIQKYGIWGLMVFVMIPLPVTGAYMGTIASYVLGMDYKKSFIATSIGVTISCLIVALSFSLGIKLF